METLLVRMRPFDPRRGAKLRRFTYAGIRFQPERGWYRVEKPVAEYLRGVRQAVGDAHAALAFDVCTDDEAKALEAQEVGAAKQQRHATDDLQVVPARTGGTVTTAELPAVSAAKQQDGSDRDSRRSKRA